MRTSRLYKRMLTVQVLLLGAHHLMSGGFADSSCYSRASHAVLSGGDPIRERLARHLHGRVYRLLFCKKEEEMVLLSPAPP